tara:strand:- start:4281 stop:4811 length:531 start_codon:yes stop_codon:yes gene_type:complete
MNELQIKINNLQNLSIQQYNEILKDCAKFREMTAMVYVYDKMKQNGVTPNEETFKHIDKLHSKNINESNKILLKSELGKKLPPRRRIHKIMKGYNYTNNYNEALQYKPIVIDYINKNPDIATINNRIIMAKQISKNCNISFNHVRYIITNLKKTKFFDKNCIKNSKQESILKYFQS